MEYITHQTEFLPHPIFHIMSAQTVVYFNQRFFMQKSWKNVKNNKFAAKFSKKMGFKSFHLDAGGLFYSLLTKTLDKFDAVKYNMVLQQSFFPYEYTPLYENGKFEHKSSQRRLLKALPKKNTFLKPCPTKTIHRVQSILSWKESIKLIF